MCFLFRKVSCTKLGDCKPDCWSFMHEKVNKAYDFKNLSKRVDIFFSLAGGEKELVM